MNLSELQLYVAERIAAEPSAVANSLAIFNPANPSGPNGIVLDDGSYPNLPGREKAFERKGLCFVVSEVAGESIEDTSKRGGAWLRVGIRVAIEESVAINRSVVGTGISLDEWMDKVWKILLGNPSPSLPPEYGIEPSGNAFTKTGTENGVRRAILDFSIRYHIGPTS